jgi:hypothetical protein
LLVGFESAKYTEYVLRSGRVVVKSAPGTGVGAGPGPTKWLTDVA